MPGSELILRDLATVLCVAAITTVLCQRFRLPVVIGYIIAGFIIGPHVPLPLVADKTNIHILSELGVILLMFSIGLELSMRALARVGASSAIVAVLEVGAMLCLGYLAGVLFGWSPRTCLFTGAIVSISSTTIVAKTFAEQGVTGGVRDVVFGVLVMEDLVAILLLAVLTTVAGGEDASAARIAHSAGRLLAFLAGLLVVGVAVVPRFMRAVQRLNRTETTVVASVGLCFATALLARYSGYSVALGAFIAGSLVAESGQGPAVELLVRPVRDLFAAIFFVAVGMQIDPHAIAGHWAAILALVLLVIVGKTLSVAVGAFLSGRGVGTSVQAGLSLAQIGEFSFIIAGLGVSTRASGAFVYPVAVAVSIATALSTPWLIRASGPLARLVDRKLPRRMQTFVVLYASWVESLRSEPGAVRSRGARLGKLLVLDAACLFATIVVTALWNREVAVLILRVTSLSFELARGLVFAGAATLGIPLFLGVVRLSRQLGVTLAMQALPAPANHGVDLGLAPRRVLVLTLQLTCLLLVGVPLVAVTQPFLPPLYGVAVLVTLLLVLGVFFWRSAANLEGHVRAGATAIADALRPGSDGGESHDDMAAIHALLPGLGAPTPVRLEQGTQAVGRTLGELHLRGLTGATVLAIRRGDGTTVVPTAQTRLDEGDVLALAGSGEAIETARQLLHQGPPPGGTP